MNGRIELSQNQALVKLQLRADKLSWKLRVMKVCLASLQSEQPGRNYPWFHPRLWILRYQRQKLIAAISLVAKESTLVSTSVFAAYHNDLPGAVQNLEEALDDVALLCCQTAGFLDLLNWRNPQIFDLMEYMFLYEAIVEAFKVAIAEGSWIVTSPTRASLN